jgi:hypothetical protein
MEKIDDHIDYINRINNHNRPGGKSLLDEALELLAQNEAIYQSLSLRGKIKWQIKEQFTFWKHAWKYRNEPVSFCSLSLLQHYLLYLILFLFCIENFWILLDTFWNRL